MEFEVSFIVPGKGKIPTKSFHEDAGFDVYASDTLVISPGTGALVHTNMIMTMPKNVYARICPRSGLAVKHYINVHAGIIDPGYTGEIKVALFNHGQHEFYVKPGDRIAQLIFAHVLDIHPVFTSKKTIVESGRGKNGFGSSSV